MVKHPSSHDVLRQARQILEGQGAALTHVSRTLDERYTQCVTLMLSCKGRIVLSGIGKSALVARKLVATFNSTGTNSIFLHAADALHGDLGMVSEDDVIMLLSKSGETSELKALLPLLRLRGNAIICMVSNPTSFLARSADLCLYLPVQQESDANNLVPTVSATVQMATGHALAISLMEMRSFSASDFAKSHPGGSLGKQLYLRVRDIVTQEDPPLVSPQASLRQVIVEISSKRRGATAVCHDGTGVVLGIITDGDLRRMLESNLDLSTVTAQQLMSAQPKSIGADEMATAALLRMRENSITQLVVTNGDQQYLGLIHLHDILREGIV
ncbi:MAG: KpsF/GutQ family sugar-phosphate isomerase [Saprospiraceae bacterium]|nr:KpsF/GutQ family sugar-phosphate isomerase [Saprospiraceae bacterium]